MDPSLLHFTYSKPDCGDLRQGDVIQKSDEIKSLLGEVHSHYLRDDYTHLMIVTQTCDLVRRSGKTNARYITLVAVRPLETVLERELEKLQRTDIERKARVCRASLRPKLGEYLSSLLNNNKSDFFYLHVDTSLSFNSSSCAFLRLPISVKCSEHYDKLMRARLLSLDDNFQAKLGHHLGQIYSRVGTEDWVPKNIKSAEFKKLIDDHLDATCEWVDDLRLQAAQKALTGDKLQRDYADLRADIASVDLVSKLSQIADRTVELVRSLGLPLDNRKAEALRNLVLSDIKMSSFLKEPKS